VTRLGCAGGVHRLACKQDMLGTWCYSSIDSPFHSSPLTGAQPVTRFHPPTSAGHVGYRASHGVAHAHLDHVPLPQVPYRGTNTYLHPLTQPCTTPTSI
jgi:hypothetical protein